MLKLQYSSRCRFRYRYYLRRIDNHYSQVFLRFTKRVWENSSGVRPQLHDQDYEAHAQEGSCFSSAHLHELLSESACKCACVCMCVHVCVCVRERDHGNETKRVKMRNILNMIAMWGPIQNNYVPKCLREKEKEQKVIKTRLSECGKRLLIGQRLCGHEGLNRIENWKRMLTTHSHHTHANVMERERWQGSISRKRKRGRERYLEWEREVLWKRGRRERERAITRHEKTWYKYSSHNRFFIYSEEEEPWWRISNEKETRFPRKSVSPSSSLAKQKKSLAVLEKNCAYFIGPLLSLLSFAAMKHLRTIY